MKIVLKRKLFSPTIEVSHKNVVFYFTKKLVQEYFAFNSERPCNPISERFNFPLLPLHDLLRLRVQGKNFYSQCKTPHYMYLTYIRFLFKMARLLVLIVQPSKKG